MCMIACCERGLGSAETSLPNLLAVRSLRVGAAPLGE
jgi:hypothetical protein